MNLIRYLFQYFSKPDNYWNDPVGHIQNQIGHAYIGNLFPTIMIWGSYRLGAGYPVEVVCFLFCMLCYFFIWEIVLQGWCGFDTVEDTCFFAAGGAVYCFLDLGDFADIGSQYKMFSGWRIIDVLFSIHAFIWAMLVPGIVKRWG